MKPKSFMFIPLTLLAIILHGPSWAQKTPASLVDVLNPTKMVTTYQNSQKEEETEIPFAEIKFPLAVIEEAENGMAKVIINNKICWLEAADFKRDYKIALPGCKLSASSSTSGANRNAGKDCPK